MKKPKLHILTAVTLIFASLTLGIFIGRNQQKGEIVISVPPEVTAPRSAAEDVTFPPATDVSVLFPININTATQAELMVLPGIGEVYARKILDYRTANGNFLRVEDLMNVPGIGEKRLEAILDLVTTGG